MRGGSSSRRDKNKHLAWKNHPLVKLLRRIRERHHISQNELSLRMHLPDQTIKLIEGGRQRLPHLIDEDGYDLSAWLKRWLKEVGATSKEREEVVQVLHDLIIGRLKDDLD